MDGKLLIGGGHNLDFETESTDAFGINETIKMYLCNLVSQYILPGIKICSGRTMVWHACGLGEPKTDYQTTCSKYLCGRSIGAGMGVAINVWSVKKQPDLLLKMNDS